MRPNPLQRQHWAPAARRPLFRPLAEFLETRIVPSIVDHSGGFASHSDLTFNGSALVNGSEALPGAQGISPLAPGCFVEQSVLSGGRRSAGTMQLIDCTGLSQTPKCSAHGAPQKR
jgi:hypothetical protein